MVGMSTQPMDSGSGNPLKQIFGFRFVDVFPPDAPETPWLLCVSMARNDLVRLQTRLLDLFALPDEPEIKAERLSTFTRLCAHTYEALALLVDKRPRGPVVDHLIQSLKLGPQRLKCLSRLHKSAFVRTFLCPMRNLVFHYAPNRVVDLLKALPSDCMTSVQVGDLSRDVALLYADDLLATAVGPTTEDVEARLCVLAPITDAVWHFVDDLVTKYVLQLPEGILEATGPPVEAAPRPTASSDRNHPRRRTVTR